jgi:catechol 2,3-dioxygenase-like lactoylglutathione lyase family enzyme
MATVRYIVSDVSEAVEFYTSHLGFEAEMHVPAFASLVRDDLTLWIAGPNASAAWPMRDGTVPGPGGWSRFVLIVDDIEAEVARLAASGVSFLNDVLENKGRKQIVLSDPSGNKIELQEGGTFPGRR